MDKEQSLALGNLISVLAVIYNKQTKKKIKINTIYKYLIDWVYYGKNNTFFE